MTKTDLRFISLQEEHTFIRFYVLFSIFITPILDIANGLIGEDSSIGIFVRAGIVLANIFIIFLIGLQSNNKVIRRESIICYACILYLGCLIFFQAALTHGRSISTDVSFIFKVLLYLTETTVLYICIKRGIITFKDFESFWKYSFWLIPIVLIIAQLTGTALDGVGNKGYFSSVNALTAVLLVQVILTMHFALSKKISIIPLVLNLIMILLVGTKTPYIFLALALVVILFFDSKNRKKILLAILLGIILIVILAFTILESEFSNIFDWHIYFIDNVNSNKTLWNYLLSGRDILLQAALESFHGFNSIIVMIFGVGPYSVFSNVGEQLGLSSMRGIEMDVFELLFSCGVFITVVVYRFFFKALRSPVGSRQTRLYLNLAIIILGCYSILGGHVITEALAGTYCAILLGYKFALSQKHHNMTKMKMGV